MKQKPKKIISLITLVILIINVPFILYLSNFKLIAFDENFYKKEFLKYNMYSEFPDKDIDKVNSDLLFYLRYDKTNDLVNIDMFNQKEGEHLLDVKKLIQKSLIFLNLMIILSIILMTILLSLNKKNFVKNLSSIFIFGGILTFLDALILYLLMEINFNFIFDVFHKMFFKAGTWLFSSNDSLVMLYQERIFYDILIRIVLYTLIMAIILTVIGLILIKIKRYINKKKIIRRLLKRRSF